MKVIGYEKGEIVSHSFSGIMPTITHSKMSAHGFDSLVIEKALSHVDPSEVRASYAHSNLFEDRVKLMQWWSDYLDTIKSNNLHYLVRSFESSYLSQLINKNYYLQSKLLNR